MAILHNMEHHLGWEISCVEIEQGWLQELLKADDYMTHSEISIPHLQNIIMSQYKITCYIFSYQPVISMKTTQWFSKTNFLVHTVFLSYSKVFFEQSLPI